MKDVLNIVDSDYYYYPGIPKFMESKRGLIMKIAIGALEAEYITRIELVEKE